MNNIQGELWRKIGTDAMVHVSVVTYSSGRFFAKFIDQEGRENEIPLEEFKLMFEPTRKINQNNMSEIKHAKYWMNYDDQGCPDVFGKNRENGNEGIAVVLWNKDFQAMQEELKEARKLKEIFATLKKANATIMVPAHNIDLLSEEKLINSKD